MRLLLMILLLFSPLFCETPKELAKKLGLVAGDKAIVQWERVFRVERKMKKYGIDKLSQKQKDELKAYLIEHAADSDQPLVAGDM